jgi:hypothetical protein
MFEKEKSNILKESINWEKHADSMTKNGNFVFLLKKEYSTQYEYCCKKLQFIAILKLICVSAYLIMVLA